MRPYSNHSSTFADFCSMFLSHLPFFIVCFFSTPYYDSTLHIYFINRIIHHAIMHSGIITFSFLLYFSLSLPFLLSLTEHLNNWKREQARRERIEVELHTFGWRHHFQQIRNFAKGTHFEFFFLNFCYRFCASIHLLLIL